MTYKIAILMTRSIYVNGREKRSGERNGERSCAEITEAEKAQEKDREGEMARRSP